MKLCVVGGVAAGRTASVDGDTVIGRDRSCDIVIHDPALSPRHARLTADGRAVDLSSTNGTRVDHGLITIGATQLRLQSDVDHDRPAITTPFNRPPRAAPPAPPEEPLGTNATRPFGAAMVLGPVLMAAAMVAIYGDPRFALFAT